MLEFRLLGPVEVRDGERVIELPRHKQRALLGALLLRAGRVVAKDELLEDLWGASPPPRAESSLQNYLSQLRRALGTDTVVTKAPGYLLRVEPEQIDVARFERLVAEGRRAEPRERAAKLREALGLVRGEHLADLRFEAFAQAEIRRLDELELTVREELLRAELELGKAPDAVPELDALVAAHPFREGLRFLLILALYRSGRQADALAAYRDARNALVDELGIEPGDELQELERAILRQDPALRGPAPDKPAATPAPGAEPATAAGRPQRKTVSVLVVSPSAAPGGSDRDPEILRAGVESFAAAALATIERYGGVAERLGDAVTAFFGIPAVHEDDPLRAVQAASELRDDLAAKAVQAGFGLAAGEVLVDAGSPRATGDVVGRAAALARESAPGEIVLTFEMSSLLGDAVSVTERVPGASVQLETIAEPRPRMLRLDSRLVGREHELEALRNALASATEQRTCHLFTLLGEAGVGKSRLITEFLGDLEERVTISIVRCLSYGASRGLTLLGSTLRSAGAEMNALRDDAPTDEALAAMRGALEALAHTRPLVLVLDDAHWAEPALLDLVEHLVDRSRSAPILLLCVSRPELYDVRPAWGGGKSNAHALFLEPLPPEESEQLLDNLLGASDLPSPVRTHIVAAAGGNPLFMEELLATLVDRAVLRRAGGRWTTEELPVLRVPATIKALIAARIDRVPEDERLALELAAIEGVVFGTGTVASLAPAEMQRRAADLLGRLVSRELIRPVRGADEVYAFRHPLVRDGAYESMPKASRAELHERFSMLPPRPDVAEPEEQRLFHVRQAQAYRLELGEEAKDPTSS